MPLKLELDGALAPEVCFSRHGEITLTNSPKSAVLGAAPEGVTDAQSASRAVREMFTSIAPRYDLLNHVLSMQHRPPVVEKNSPNLRRHTFPPTRGSSTYVAARET